MSTFRLSRARFATLCHFFHLSTFRKSQWLWAISLSNGLPNHWNDVKRKEETMWWLFRGELGAAQVLQETGVSFQLTVEPGSHMPRQPPSKQPPWGCWVYGKDIDLQWSTCFFSVLFSNFTVTIPLSHYPILSAITIPWFISMMTIHGSAFPPAMAPGEGRGNALRGHRGDDFDTRRTRGAVERCSSARRGEGAHGTHGMGGMRVELVGKTPMTFWLELSDCISNII